MNKNTRSIKEVRQGFLKAIRKAAKEFDVDPSDVDQSQFWTFADGFVTEWELRKYGGFASFKETLSPRRPQESEINDFFLKHEQKLGKRSTKRWVLDENFLQLAESFASKVFQGSIRPSPAKIKSKPTARVLTAVLSDLHFGSNVKENETGVSDYGTAEESRRMAALVREIADYKIQYRSETELELLIIGDIIQNRLHDPAEAAPVAEQFARAVHLLSQAVGYLAGHFKTIRVRCVTGNHGRNTGRHHERAVNQKFDSIETMIYYSVKCACSKLKNVEFFIPRTPYVIYDVLGNKFFTTHGDTVLRPGTPQKSIDVKSLEEQINRINASLPDQGEYKAFIVGHVHIPSMTHLNNGAVMITNGCLLPPDEFAVSIGNLEQLNTGQWIFESIREFPIGDCRLIKVGRKHDEDESLDKIIRPWKNF